MFGSSRLLLSLLLLLVAMLLSLAVDTQHTGSSSIRMLQGSSFKYAPSTLTLVSDSPYKCGIQRAAFGNPLLDLIVSANLMILPDDEMLCDFPEYLKDNTLATFTSPIALFVSAEGCSVEQKARVVLELQKAVTPQIKFLILDNPGGSAKLIELQLDDHATVDLFSDLGVLSVNRFCGEEIGRRLKDTSIRSGADPRLLQPANKGWKFLVVIDNALEETMPSNIPQEIDNNFSWMRHLIFAFLVVTPALCASTYVWYRGGGRFRLRRDEQGRITGIEHVQSTSFLLGPTQHAAPTLRVISKEQFNALPEILYRPASEEQGKSPDFLAEVAVETCDASATTTVTYGFCSDDSEANAINDEVKDVDVEQPPSFSPVEDLLPGQTACAYSGDGPVVDLTTKCTTCSICIDEYEVGERLTFLPRCQHAFHRDCIMPWLLERQGRCPLCKSHVVQGKQQDDSVITDEESDENADEESNENDPPIEQALDEESDEGNRISAIEDAA